MLILMLMLMVQESKGGVILDGRGYLWENRIETESSEISLRHQTVEELSSPTLPHTMPTERRKDATFTSLSQATQGLAH